MINKSTKRKKKEKNTKKYRFEVWNPQNIGKRKEKSICIIPAVTAACTERSNANGYKKPGEELGETLHLQNCFKLIQKVCLVESVRIVKKMLDLDM